MKKKYVLPILVFLAILFNPDVKSFAQCPNDNILASATPANPTLGGWTGWTLPGNGIGSGEYVEVNVCAGATYTFTMADNATVYGDPVMTLYNSAGGAALAFNDNNTILPAPGNLLPQITWTATFTGVVNVVIDQSGCTVALGDEMSVVVYQLSACGIGGGPGEPCNSDVGTFSYLLNGSPVSGGSQVYLCAEGGGDCFTFNSNDDYILPPPTANNPFEVSELMWALYSCPPSGGNPTSDPCYTGSTWTGEDFNDCNPSGYGLTGTIYFVPVTADDSDNAGDPNGVFNFDQDGDGCLAVGTSDWIAINYLNAIAVSTSSSSCAGTVTLNVTGGQPEFDASNYTVTNNSNGSLTGLPVSHNGSFQIDGLTNGDNWSVTISDASGCSNTFTGTFSGDATNPSINCPSNITVNNDFGNCSAVVNYSAPVGTDNCPTPTTTQIAGLAPGSAFPIGTTTNTFEVTDQIGNTATCSFDVTVNDTEDPTINCPGNMTVSNDPGNCSAVVNYSVTAADNCPGESITQTTGLSSGSAFPVGTTTNTFVVTDASGNTATCSFDITVNDTENTPPTITGDTEYCAGGTASISTQSYVDYSWSNGANTQNTTVTNADNPITVTVTFANGCVGTSAPYNVTENPNPTPTITGDTEYCAGSTASISTGAFSSYNWSNGANTQNTTVTNADNPITVTVTDANGCTGTSAAYNVTENPSPTPTITGDTEYCAGGTASISTGAFSSYNWSNGANTQNTTVTDADNAITVTVTDANGCTGTSAPYNVTENPNPTPTITGDTEYCAGSTASISTGAFSSYNWSNGANTQNTTVTDADNAITVTVTDANGCTGTSAAYNVTENPNPTPTITGDTEYCAGSTASISTGVFSSYNWSNGANTQNTTVTNADNPITVTVTDANGCTGTSAAYNVTENPSPTPTITGDTEYCAGGTASISTGAFSSYNWSNGANTQNTTVTDADNAITVTVTDANGCTGTSAPYNVTENPNPTPTITGDTEYCAGSTASISTGAFSSYNWSNGANTQNTTVTDADNAITVTVTDANGCTGTSAAYTVTENPNPTPTITGDTEYCAGSTASISTGAFSSYNWSNGANTQNTTVTNADNPITVTVTDANGCTGTSASYNVTENPNPTPTITGDTEYCEGSTASISTGAFSSYNWSNGANTQNTTVTDADNAITVTVTDANGCTGTSAAYNVTENPSPTPTITGDTEYCAGSTASISTGAFSSYNWSNGANTQNTTVTDADNAITVTVTDANGCTGTSAAYNVTENPNPTPTITGDTEYCEGSTASISTGAFSSYNWSNGANTQNTTVTDADNAITVTVTDANGCTGTSASYNVTENPNPQISLSPTDPTVCNGTDGFITVNSVSGATSGDVSWTGTASGTDNSIGLPHDISGLSSGNYDVTFTDINGCVSNTESTVLTDPGAPILDPISDTSSCGVDFVVPDPTTFITGSNLTGNQSFYSATGGNPADEISQGTVITSGMSPMTIYVYDNNGTCSSEISFDVIVNESPVVTISPDPAEVCEGTTITLDGNPNGGSGTYTTHDWSGDVSILSTTNIQAPSTLSGATAGSYNITYTVTDNNGCSGTDDITVEINEIPEITSLLEDVEYCDYEVPADIEFTVSGQPDWNIEYTLDGVNQTVTSSQNNINLGNTPGVYNITVIEDNYCSDTINVVFELVIKPTPSAPVTSADEEYCLNEELDTMNAVGSGGTLTWYLNGLQQFFDNGENVLPQNVVGSTAYFVTETIDGCESEPSEVQINIIECDFVLSTAITPDGDGLNDTWIIPDLDAIYPDNVVRVYNRWGNLIYEHNSSKEGPYNDNPWNGKINGKTLPVGSYYFIIDHNDESGETTNGAVSVILD